MSQRYQVNTQEIVVKIHKILLNSLSPLMMNIMKINLLPSRTILGQNFRQTHFSSLPFASNPPCCESISNDNNYNKSKVEGNRVSPSCCCYLSIVLLLPSPQPTNLHDQPLSLLPNVVSSCLKPLLSPDLPLSLLPPRPTVTTVVLATWEEATLSMSTTPMSVST